MVLIEDFLRLIAEDQPQAGQQKISQSNIIQFLELSSTVNLIFQNP
jgi:hypothetical protein